jgi:hypothetical protein
MNKNNECLRDCMLAILCGLSRISTSATNCMVE